MMLHCLGLMLFLAAQSSMPKYESAYYAIESDLPPERVRWIGKVMDAVGKEYYERFNGYSGTVRQKLKIKVFSTKDEYVSALKRASEGSKAAYTSGVFVPLDETVYTFDSPVMENVLRHECFHQFTHFVVGGRLDKWVNEGLAEYFSAAKVNPSTGSVTLGAIIAGHVLSLAEAADEGMLMPVTDVLTLSGRDWHENMGSPQARIQYAQSWALCHFLIHAEGGKYQKAFDEYMRLVDKHLDGGTAFKRVFGDDPEPLQEKYSAYVEHLIATTPIEAVEEYRKKAGRH